MTAKKKKPSEKMKNIWIKKQQINIQTNEKTFTRKGLYNQMAFWQLLEEQR